jgi:predicted nucleic-acid-binding Zn-ribbon protein
VTRDEFRFVDSRNDCPTCRCGASTERIIQAPAMVMNDIQPYRSMIDGSVINSRSQHRAHLKSHGCIEVGNEKMKPKPLEAPPGTKQAVIDAYRKARK